MSLQNVPRDLVIKIWEYLEKNKDSINLLCTCKYFYKVGKDNGFIKSIVLSNNTDSIDYIENYHNHIKSLNYIKISSNIIPNNWIFKRWPKIVILDNCNFSEIIKPNQITNTESLSITEFRHNRKTNIKVDWKMFPNLKFLKIYAYQFDNTDLTKYCNKLIKVDLDLVL